MKDLLVRDLMSDDVIAVSKSDDLAVLHDLMTEHRIRHVPVVDEDGDLAGLVSHRDLLRHALIEQDETTPLMQQQRLELKKAWELMVPTVETVESDTALSQAAQLMIENKYGCLPVVEGRHLVGILTESDFVRLFAREDG